MPNLLAALAVALLVAIVISRLLWMRRQGIQAMVFGKTHPSDFLLPPFVLFYFYLIFAAAFSLPTPARSLLFHSTPLVWIGVFFCFAAVGLMLWSVISFGRSFRVGIDADHPDSLVTTGAFALSRNPIYTAFAFFLLGQFLVFPNWIMLVYLLAGYALFHRQVLREEAWLQTHYGEAFAQYRRRVRRYL
jgi:protein-S-isoprenylcysteine O-methyltransferase Ste14